MRKRLVELLVPVAAAAIFALLNLFPFYQTAEQRVYDLFLHIKPAIAQRNDILLLDVDDTAISNVGLWPWSRDYMARGLIRLREFDANYVAFDVEYVDASPQAVDGRFLKTDLPEIFDVDFSNLVGQIGDLFGAVQSGQISLKDAGDFVGQWANNAQDVKESLLSRVDSVVQDNDSFLGRAAAFNGKAFFTVNILNYDELTKHDNATVDAKAVEPNVEVKSEHGLRSGVDIRPAITPVLSGARGAGFPNVVVDPDGVRRRIDLIAEVGDRHFAQLVTAPLLDWLGHPEVVVTRNAVTLDGAKLPGSDTPVDLRIPLATDGRMLINWPKGSYEATFRHLSYWNLVFDWQTEDDMLELLRAIAPVLGYYFTDSDNLVSLYDSAQQLQDSVLAGGDRSQIDTWREDRKQFFQTLGDFVSSDALDAYSSDVQAAIDSGQYSPGDVSRLQQNEAAVRTYFTNLHDLYDQFAANRETLQTQLPGSFIIIGWVGTSTTDIGVTPFDEEYMNVGTHASVLNTILQQKFLDDLPWAVALAVMFAFALVVTLVIRNLDPTPSLLVGFGALLVIVAGGIGLFLATGIYLNMMTPLLGVFLTFVVLTVIKFVRENQQKLEIRNAFGHYMSEEVVRQVTEDPTKLALGGVKKHLTAMFTDIKGFSTISESLEPEQLTDLLNRYLGAMSDIILQEGGTIDKYEGDAIIAFFGAPIDQEDSAVRACRAAIAMKKREMELNQVFLAEKLTPSPINTRIGVNTGDMVVGNMGTATRMDYTAMGHNMNLAARLEGVNKQYGTWILISEQTYRETYNEEIRAFSVRKLDRVRVVGISEPVRLFELIDLREAVDESDELIAKLRTFNSGLVAFEEKNWADAEKSFMEILQKYPEDGPAKYYVDRLTEFKTKGAPPKNWDGVFNLTSK